MPLVRIDLLQGKSAEYRRAIGDAVLDALIATFNVPPDDRFQIITEHASNDFIVDANYLGVERSADCVIIQLTVSDTRTLEQKRALYQAIADNLNRRLALRREDVFINLLEVRVENWSFGNGEAQYAPRPN